MACLLTDHSRLSCHFSKILSPDELAADLFPDAWSASGLDDSCGGDVGTNCFQN